MLHRAVEYVAHLDPVELGVGAADLVGDRPAVLAVARSNRLVEGKGHVGGADFNRLGHIVGRHTQPLGELRDSRLASELVFHLLVDSHHRCMELLEAARKADRRSLVPEVTLDLARHCQSREGRELKPEVGVEALDGFDETEVADLHDVVQGLAAVLELSGEEVHEIVIRIDELLADAFLLGRVGGLPVTAMERPQLLAGNPLLCSHAN